MNRKYITIEVCEHQKTFLCENHNNDFIFSPLYFDFIDSVYTQYFYRNYFSISNFYDFARLFLLAEKLKKRILCSILNKAKNRERTNLSLRKLLIKKDPSSL